MRYLFACLFLFLFTRISTAQTEFAPPGAEWYFGFHSPGLLEVRGYDHYWYAGDSVVQGIVCKKILRQTVYTTLTDPPIPYDTGQAYTMLYRQQGDSVLEMFAGALRLRWMMHPQPLDTFSVGSFIITVDSVQQVVLNGETFDKIWVKGRNPSTLQAGNNVYYDRLGAVWGFGLTVCWGYYDCYPATMCRYSDDNFPAVEFPNPVCGVLAAAEGGSTPTTDPAAAAGDWVRVYPNPCQDELNVAWTGLLSEKAEMQILGATGAVVRTLRLDHGTTTLRLESLPAGIYAYRIFAENREAKGRFVKM